MINFVAGSDFGSDSVRVILVETETGKLVSEATCSYPRWMEGKFCDPIKSQFRQHPLDYIEAFESAMKDMLKQTPDAREYLSCIAVDTTGSTPCPVNSEGIPLALLPEFSNNPNAMFHLWKDHTATLEAKEIDNVFSSGDIDYTKFQGTYSAEWYWAKILHTIRVDSTVKKAAWAWVEHCDWIPALLTGKTHPETMYRCSCAAGHKALWHSEFHGLPEAKRLGMLDPYLVQVAEHYGTGPKNAGTMVGTITKEWANRLGISENTIIGGSSFDAHAGAVGAGICPNTLVKVIGTSTVDMLIEDAKTLTDKDMRSFCGQAENSIIPGYIGVEAGQAAFGDIYAWFRDLLLWPVKNALSSLPSGDIESIYNQLYNNIIPILENQASILDDSDNILALDWFNGRRYPKLNENVMSAIIGLNLGSTAPRIYRALALATVFGSKRIFESLVSHGVTIDRIIAVGGIARKSKFVMQLMSDVLERPIMVCSESQLCARGAAIYAAVAAGAYPSITDAQHVFCEKYHADYFPDLQNSMKYAELYNRYVSFGDYIDFNNI
jgi:L-ribulokinase